MEGGFGNNGNDLAMTKPKKPRASGAPQPPTKSPQALPVPYDPDRRYPAIAALNALQSDDLPAEQVMACVARAAKVIQASLGAWGREGMAATVPDEAKGAIDDVCLFLGLMAEAFAPSGEGDGLGQHYLEYRVAGLSAVGGRGRPVKSPADQLRTVMIAAEVERLIAAGHPQKAAVSIVAEAERIGATNIKAYLAEYRARGAWRRNLVQGGSDNSA